MIYLPNRVDDKLTSVVRNLCFARLSSADEGRCSPWSEDVQPVEMDSSQYIIVAEVLIHTRGVIFQRGKKCTAARKYVDGEL